MARNGWNRPPPRNTDPDASGLDHPDDEALIEARRMKVVVEREMLLAIGEAVDAWRAELERDDGAHKARLSARAETLRGLIIETAKDLADRSLKNSDVERARRKLDWQNR